MPAVEQCLDSPGSGAAADLELIGDVAVLHLSSDAFVDLEPRQRVMAYHLARAAVAGDAIVWAQRTPHGVALKHLVEATASTRDSFDAALRAKVERFAQQIVLHKGVFDTWTGRKLAFEITAEELREACMAALRAGAFAPEVNTPEQLDRLLSELRPVLFEPEGPSTLRGRTAETADRAGRTAGPKVAAGEAAGVLRAVVEELRAASTSQDPSAKLASQALIEYFETGKEAAWRRYTAAFAVDRTPVQAAMGFLDTWQAPGRGHAAFGAGVFLTAPTQPEAYAKLAANVPSLASGLPWPQGHKLPVWAGSSVQAVVPLTLAGAMAPAAPDAVTLPLDATSAGSAAAKTLVLAPVVEPAMRVIADAVVRAFLPDPSVEGDARRCLPRVYEALPVLRHVLGHGVGRFATSSDVRRAQLAEHGPVVREARADLIALRAALDPAVVDAGLLPDARCAQLVPAAYAAQHLLELRNLDAGGRLVTARGRASALVVERLLERGALREVRREGAVVLAVADAARWAVATEELLRELLRIEALGDKAAAERLVQKAAAPVAATWRDSVRARAAQLRLPRAFVAVAPRLKALRDGNGTIVDATIVDSLSLLDTALADAGKIALP